ncbi:MAG: MerR family transcriptional regulator [Clostridiaceae bacterium]|jgi:DNA-binding transcriptional MerR regulator|nr:MerR family transcriptional regulator [Clostridiaceae bacterium]
MYYSIGQFADISHMSIDTLRYYEKEKLIFVDRDAHGRRRYTDKDVQWILFIRRLKETGMPIKEIRRYAALRYQGDSTIDERLQMLEQHRQYILAEKAKWESHLTHLEEKIQIYEDKIRNR